MSLEELRRRPLAFVDDLERPVLAAADHQHLARALRVRPGEAITVADGAGRWRLARLGADRDDVCPVDGEIVAEAPPGHPITVAFAPVKGDRSDLVVQKLTELGVDRIVPVRTERSVVTWDAARAAKQRERHRRIAREAAMQSRNPRLPSVELLTTLGEFLAACPEAVLADPAGRAVDDGDRVIVVGPEGGFSPDELDGRSSVRLPGRILRTETAAITAAVLAVDRRRLG